MFIFYVWMTVGFMRNCLETNKKFNMSLLANAMRHLVPPRQLAASGRMLEWERKRE
jgi:hypothetical protein